MEMTKVKLGDVCKEFHSGKGILAADISEKGDFPVFGGNGLRGYTDRYNQDGAYLIIGRQGAYCGNVRYNIGKAYLTEHAIVGQTKEEHNAIYLAFKLSLMNLAQFQGQSAQPGLSVDTLSKIELLMPSKGVQDKIAKILMDLDDKIALNKKMNQKLEAMAKRLYDYWFVQFDFPDENGRPYKTSGGPMTYNETLKRKIPSGWECSSILEKNIYNSDFTANGSFNDLGENVKYNDGSPYALLIRIVDFNDDFSKSDNFVWVNKHSYDYLKTSSLHGGEIIICNVGNAGATYRCPFLSCPMTLGPNGVVVNDKFYNNYLYMYFRSRIGQQQLKSISSGSIQLKFNKTSFRNIPILIPDNKIISLFNEKYDVIYSKMNNLWMENRKLFALRDKLLPLLMNGQVTVD